MDVQKVENDKIDITMLKNLKPGTTFETSQKHILVKVDLNKSLQHNNFVLKINGGHCLAFNPKHGTIRALPEDTEVKLLDSKLLFWDIKDEDEKDNLIKNF